MHILYENGTNAYADSEDSSKVARRYRAASLDSSPFVQKVGNCRCG